MGEQLMTICDRCGAVKRETNHWWRVTIYRRYDINLDKFENCLAIIPFDATFPATTELRVQESEPRQAVCGAQCLFGAVADFMLNGSITKEKRGGKI